MSETQGAAARLSRLPEHVRNHPLFRQGYNLGYSDRAQDEHLTEISQNGLRLLQGDSPKPSPSYGVDAGGLRGRLIPGASVIRDLSAATAREVATEVPCCGRRITVPALDGQTSAAACCRCGVLYTVTVVEEEPDGYNDDPLKVAVFVVDHVNAATAHHRAGRWELAPGPRRSGADSPTASRPPNFATAIGRWPHVQRNPELAQRQHPDRVHRQARQRLALPGGPAVA